MLLLLSSKFQFNIASFGNRIFITSLLNVIFNLDDIIFKNINFKFTVSKCFSRFLATMDAVFIRALSKS